MKSKQIVIQTPGATGNQAYTGIGFQGKLLIIESVNRADAAAHTGDAADACISLGAATSSTNRICMSGRSKDNLATSAVSNSRNDNLIIRLYDGAASLETADFVSFDADGFTINWTKVGATRSYICTVLGGDDFQAIVGLGS